MQNSTNSTTSTKDVTNSQQQMFVKHFLVHQIPKKLNAIRTCVAVKEKFSTTTFKWFTKQVENEFRGDVSVWDRHCTKVMQNIVKHICKQQEFEKFQNMSVDEIMERLNLKNGKDVKVFQRHDLNFENCAFVCVKLDRVDLLLLLDSNLLLQCKNWTDLILKFSKSELVQKSEYLKKSILEKLDKNQNLKVVHQKVISLLADIFSHLKKEKLVKEFYYDTWEGLLIQLTDSKKCAEVGDTIREIIHNKVPNLKDILHITSFVVSKAHVNNFICLIRKYTDGTQDLQFLTSKRKKKNKKSKETGLESQMQSLSLQQKTKSPVRLNVPAARRMIFHALGKRLPENTK